MFVKGSPLNVRLTCCSIIAVALLVVLLIVPPSPFAFLGHPFTHPTKPANSQNKWWCTFTFPTVCWWPCKFIPTYVNHPKLSLTVAFQPLGPEYKLTVKLLIAKIQNKFETFFK